MSDRDEKFVRYWKPKQEAGNTRFILSMVAYWLIFALVLDVLQFFIFQISSNFSYRSLLIKSIFLGMASFFYARYNWKVNERKFAELESKIKSEVSDQLK